MKFKERVVSMFPRSTKDFVLRIIAKNKLRFIVSFVKNNWYKITPLYYGILKHQDDENIKFNLRRDVHRIEKGLSYENKKEVFAQGYILKLVKALKQAYDHEQIDQDTLEWSVSVLEKYFSIVRHEGKILIAYNLYCELNIRQKNKNFIPYPSSERPSLSISYADLEQLARRRRSVRFFEDRVIEIEKIEKAINIAKLSPSACNRLSYRYLYFNDPEVANKLSQIPGGVSGYKLNNLFVIVGEYAGYKLIRDASAPIIDASLSSMSLLFALETLGLGAVCINWPNEPDKEKRIRSILDLKKSEFVIMLMGVGYPKETGMVPYSKKRTNDDLLLINKRIK